MFYSAGDGINSSRHLQIGFCSIKPGIRTRTSHVLQHGQDTWYIIYELLHQEAPLDVAGQKEPRHYVLPSTMHILNGSSDRHLLQKDQKDSQW